MATKLHTHSCTNNPGSAFLTLWLQAYKQLALKKHPDKNKDNPNAGVVQQAGRCSRQAPVPPCL
jgi:hypothetical protein